MKYAKGLKTQGHNLVVKNKRPFSEDKLQSKFAWELNNAKMDQKQRPNRASSFATSIHATWKFGGSNRHVTCLSMVWWLWLARLEPTPRETNEFDSEFVDFTSWNLHTMLARLSDCLSARIGPKGCRMTGQTRSGKGFCLILLAELPFHYITQTTSCMQVWDSKQRSILGTLRIVSPLRCRFVHLRPKKIDGVANWNRNLWSVWGEHNFWTNPFSK